MHRSSSLTYGPRACLIGSRFGVLDIESDSSAELRNRRRRRLEEEKEEGGAGADAKY